MVRGATARSATCYNTKTPSGAAVKEGYSKDGVDIFLFTMRIGPHVVNELPHHAVPLALVILSSIFAIGHQFYLIGEAQNVGELFEQVQAVAFKAVVPVQRLVRFLIHDIRVFLKESKFCSISFTKIHVRF